MRVWWGTEAAAATAEDLAPGQQLRMNLKSDNRFKSHNSQIAHAMMNTIFELRIRVPGIPVRTVGSGRVSPQTPLPEPMPLWFLQLSSRLD